MCHAEGSRPSAPPGAAGVVAERGDLTLRAADGADACADAWRHVLTFLDGVRS